MNLLERYLQAIGQNLPPSTRDDVLNELRANLTAQIDDREEEVGRPLTEPEVAAILKAHGRPEVVAMRYQQQNYLIGPTLFPFYMLTMRRVLPFVVLIYLIANAVRLFAAQNWLGSLPGLLVEVAFQLVPTLIIWWACMTLAFAFVERAKSKLGEAWLNDWNPSKLPALRTDDGKKERSLLSRIADLAFHCLWMAYVIEFPRHPFLLFGPSWPFIQTLHITWAPVWHSFYTALWFLLLIQLGIKIANLFSAVRRWSVPLDIISKLFGIVVTSWLASAGIYLVANGAGANLRQLAIVNHWIGVSFRIVLAFMILDLAIQAWKYLRPHIPVARLAF